jgi:hypothetical protein
LKDALRLADGATARAAMVLALAMGIDLGRSLAGRVLPGQAVTLASCTIRAGWDWTAADSACAWSAVWPWQRCSCYRPPCAGLVRHPSAAPRPWPRSW